MLEGERSDSAARLESGSPIAKASHPRFSERQEPEDCGPVAILEFPIVPPKTDDADVTMLLTPALLAPLQEPTYFSGSQRYEGFGTTLCALGDLDLDGVPEFAIGSPGGREPEDRFSPVRYPDRGSVTILDTNGDRDAVLVSSQKRDGYGAVALVAFGCGSSRALAIVAPGLHDVASGPGPYGRIEARALARPEFPLLWTFENGEPHSKISGLTAIDSESGGAQDLFVSITSDRGVLVTKVNGRSGEQGHVTNLSPLHSFTHWPQIVSIGDTNADGVSEVAIAIERIGEPAKIVILDGRFGSKIAAFDHSGRWSHGIALCRVPDADADERDDIAVLGSLPSRTGVLDIYSSATTRLLRTYPLADEDGDQLEGALLSLPGTNDLLVATTNPSATSVRRLALSGEQAWKMTSKDEGLWFGAALAASPCASRTSSYDILIGHPGGDGVVGRCGRVLLLSCDELDSGE